MKVKEFMIEDVIIAHPNDSIKAVMTIFVERKVGGLPICDDDGYLLGMVSDGDILRSIKPIERRIYDFVFYMDYLGEENLQSRLSDLSEKEIIKIAKTKGIITVSPEDEIEHAVTLLSKHHFKKLPVVDQKNRVVGVISRGDVIRKIQRSLLKEM
ncbi:CBS domain-containing protein [Cytobacillus sp. FJAT-53684]|uniref:CBS domain-containing protein n=1 Tax=Cytobacillus mangrovibacter TaxID=3299024 RepID=A0ABW6K138_9BACI